MQKKVAAAHGGAGLHARKGGRRLRSGPCPACQFSDSLRLCGHSETSWLGCTRNVQLDGAWPHQHLITPQDCDHRPGGMRATTEPSDPWRSRAAGALYRLREH
jgi:hypothetical protein